jgi:hypothetical protein
LKIGYGLFFSWITLDIVVRILKSPYYTYNLNLPFVAKLPREDLEDLGATTSFFGHFFLEFSQHNINATAVSQLNKFEQ